MWWMCKAFVWKTVTQRCEMPCVHKLEKTMLFNALLYIKKT